MQRFPEGFHRVVYATNADPAHVAYAAFERTWSKRCPGVVASLREGGDELLTFFRFPEAQWKTLRTPSTIERLHGEVRRPVKTQGSLPSEDATLVLLFSLVASGQIRLRKIDSWRKIATVLRPSTHRQQHDEPSRRAPGHGLPRYPRGRAPALLRSAPSRSFPRSRAVPVLLATRARHSFVTHVPEEALPDLGRAAKIPVLCCAALATYQGTTDEPIAPQRRVSSVVLAHDRIPEPSRYTAPPAAFIALRGSR
jgi:mutator family transposase